MTFSRRLIVLAVCLALIPLALADTKLIEKVHTDAIEIMGQSQPAQDVTNTVWFFENGLRSDSGHISTIIRLDLNKMFIINRELKTYMESDLPVDLKKFLPAGVYEQASKMLAMKLTVTPTDETKKIGEYNCRKYDVTLQVAMQTAHSVQWASTEVPVPEASRKAIASSMFATQSDQAPLINEYMKIAGYRVHQETTMNVMGVSVKTVEDLVSAEEVKVPAGHYDPPAGFEKKDFNLQMLQRQS